MVTDRSSALPVGASLAFTLSQAGMVAHWRKNGGSWHHLLINGIGAAATGLTVVVVVAAKFMQGASIVVLLLPAAILLMTRVQRHYQLVSRETEARGRLLQNYNQHPPIVIVPIERWNAATQKTLRFAMTLSPEVQVVHVACGEDDSIAAEWQSTVEQPTREAGAPVPRLITLRSPYRLVLQPVVDYVLQVESPSYHRGSDFDHGRAPLVPLFPAQPTGREVLTAMLLLEGDRRINIINVPWYLKT